MAPITRRNVLKAAGLGAVALGSTAFAPVPGPVRVAATRPPQAAALGDPVEGPLASVYHRYGTPRGVVLGHTGDATTGRAVTWQTTGSIDPGTVVRYAKVPPGTDPRTLSLSDLHQETSGVVMPAPSGLYEDDTDETVAIEGEHPSLIHRASLTLEPGEVYAYSVGGSGFFTPIRTVKPTPGRTDRWTFTHNGDHGTTLASRRATAELARRDPDLHLMAGDIAYADGYQPGWDAWQNEVSPLAGRVPLITSPGNHESKDYHGESYRKRIARPNTGGSIGNQHHFGFTYNNVFFLSSSGGAFLGDTQSFQGATDLVEELVRTELLLADAARRRAAGEIDFLVFTQHFPLYTNHDTRGPISAPYVVALEHILQRWQVDLVLVGHDHMYQRSQPMAYGVPTGVGPEEGGPGYTQVVAGSGGKSLYDFVDLQTFAIPAPPPSDPTAVPDYVQQNTHRRGPWSEADILEFCFVEYDVTPGRMQVTGWVFPDYTDGASNTYDYAGADSSGDGERIRATTEVDDTDVPVDWLAPVPGDEFTVLAKNPLAQASAARQEVRSPSEIIGDLPEAAGEFVWRDRDDCTQHHH